MYGCMCAMLPRELKCWFVYKHDDNTVLRTGS